MNALEALTVLKAILLGLLRGLLGLMPLSSRGHLLLLEKLSGAELSGAEMQPFFMALHAGAILAILISCLGPLCRMLRHPLRSELKWVILSALPLLGVSLLLKHTGWLGIIGKSALTLLPFAFLFTAVMLFLSSRIGADRRVARTQHDKPNFGDALSLGLMQCLSIFTGVSLTGMELTGSLSSGLKPKKAAEFAFLSCVTALLALYLPETVQLIGSGAAKSVLNENGALMLAGFLASALTGFLGVKLAQLAVKKEKLSWTALYLALLAIVTAVLSMAHRL